MSESAAVLDVVPGGVRYDWDAWTDGNPHILVHGVDFACSVRSFQQAAWRYARRAGLGVRTQQVGVGTPERVKIRFFAAPSE